MPQPIEPLGDFNQVQNHAVESRNVKVMIQAWVSCIAANVIQTSSLLRRRKKRPGIGKPSERLHSDFLEAYTALEYTV